MHNVNMTNIKMMMGLPRETHAEFLQAAQNHKPQHYKACNYCTSNIEILVTQKLYDMHDYIHSASNVRHYQNQTFFTPRYAQYYKVTLYPLRTLHSKSKT